MEHASLTGSVAADTVIVRLSSKGTTVKHKKPTVVTQHLITAERAK
jgi:hypothetical protein